MSAISDYDIKPGEGWGPFRLGETRSKMNALLKEVGIDFDEERSEEGDRTELLLDHPFIVLTFDGTSDSSTLLQIYVEASEITVAQEMPATTSLDDMLVALGVKSFADTTWREEDPNEDFASEPVDVSKRDDEELLDHGTLWLKQQGIGLQMLAGRVDGVVVRRAQDVPQNGFGPLSERQLERALTLKERWLKTVASAGYQPGPLKPYMPYLKPIWATLCVLAFLTFLGLAAYREYAWRTAAQTTGTLVEKIPADAVFPDDYVYQYDVGDGVKRTTKLKSQFVGMPEIGSQCDLRFLANRPDEAVTESQARMNGFVDYIWYLFAVGAAWIAFSLLEAFLG